MTAAPVAPGTRARRLRSTLAAVVATLLLGVGTVLAGAGTAEAHSTLVGSDPADGSSVATGPSTVTLTFDEPIQRGSDVLRVVGPDGNLWSTGDTQVQGARVSTAVTPLGPAGQYTVAYRVVSADGHPVTGTRTFTLTTAGSGTPGPPAAEGAASSGSSTGWWVGGGVLVVVAAGTALLVVRRRGRTTTA